MIKEAESNGKLNIKNEYDKFLNELKKEQQEFTNSLKQFKSDIKEVELFSSYNISTVDKKYLRIKSLQTALEEAADIAQVFYDKETTIFEIDSEIDYIDEVKTLADQFAP